MQKEIDFIVYMFDGLFPNSFFPSEIAKEKKNHYHLYMLLSCKCYSDIQTLKKASSFSSK